MVRSPAVGRRSRAGSSRPQRQRHTSIGAVGLTGDAQRLPRGPSPACRVGHERVATDGAPVGPRGLGPARGQPPWQGTPEVESLLCERQGIPQTLRSGREAPRDGVHPSTFRPGELLCAVIDPTPGITIQCVIGRGAPILNNRLDRLRVRTIMHLLTDPMFYVCMLTNFTVIYLTALAGSGRDNASADECAD